MRLKEEIELYGFLGVSLSGQNLFSCCKKIRKESGVDDLFHLLWFGFGARHSLELKAFWWILVEAVECLSPSNFHL